jgi:hypothetical protein
MRSRGQEGADLSEEPDITIFSNPQITKGYAVFWLGDVRVAVCRLGSPDVPTPGKFDAVDLNPDDFAEAVAFAAIGEPQGSS